MEFEMSSFLEAHGISKEVAEAYNFEYFAPGEVDKVIETCRGFGKSDEELEGWAQMFHDTDGVTEPRYNLDGEAVMPEMKVFWPVKTGPSKNHVHSDLGDNGWQMENLLMHLPTTVLSAYVIITPVSPPKEVKLRDGSLVLKWKKTIVDDRKKVVFKHSHDMMTDDELTAHLKLLHGVADNFPKKDKVHAHSFSCYDANSKSMRAHINKGIKAEAEAEKEWYTTPSQ